MAAAGLYTFGGSFWEFGEPDWEHTRYFLMFGVAEDHASNPIKMALGKLKAKGVKFVAVNPVRTGYGAIADEWIGIRPGTDGLFVGSLIHELMKAEKIDLEYLVRFTNSPWLVIDDPGSADDGLFARDGDGKPLAFDRKSGTIVDATRSDISPALTGTFKLADGRNARPAFALIAERYLAETYSPETTAATTGVPAETVSRIARELAQAAFEQQITLDIPWTDWTGRRHEKTVGRPVSMHAMRGISAHANGFQTCRMLHLLQILLGSIDCPGGFRYKAPFPRPAPPANRPARPSGPDTPLKGAPLGFPQGPEDLLVDASGKPQRIDKAYSWDAPLAAHGLMHMVITNAAKGDPYPVDVLFMFMANMSWNSSMNIPAVLKHLTETDPATGEYKHSEDHLLGRLLIRNDRVRRPDPARHDVSGALGLHLAAGPPDLRPRWPCGRDPPAGGSARPRRARLPDRAARHRRAAQAAGLRHRRRPAALSRRLCRLHRQSRAHARHRVFGRLPRRRRQKLRARRAQSQAARRLYRGRLLPSSSSDAGAELLQARQPGVSRLGQAGRLHRRCQAGGVPALS